MATLCIIRDFLFRLFFIYPKTDYTGRYAALIEDRFIPRWVIRELKRGTQAKDIVFLGNSHLMDAIDPAIIEKNCGRTSYNIALYGLPSQYSLELMLQNKYFPKLLFIDFSTRYSTYEPNNQYVQSLISYWSNPPKWKVLVLDAIDRVHFLFPSLFVPFEYFFLLKRTWNKLVEYRRKGWPSLGRYTPFRLLASYSWKLDKVTNHRIVERIRDVTEAEARFEEYLLKKSINETETYCSPGSALYNKSMAETALMLEEIRSNGTRIVLIRLPLHRSFIEFENANYQLFIGDLKKLADRYAINFLDLSEQSHLAKIGPINFYGDGQHVDNKSAQRISNYLSQLIITKYKNNFDDQFVLH